MNTSVLSRVFSIRITRLFALAIAALTTLSQAVRADDPYEGNTYAIVTCLNQWVNSQPGTVYHPGQMLKNRVGFSFENENSSTIYVRFCSFIQPYPGWGIPGYVEHTITVAPNQSVGMEIEAFIEAANTPSYFSGGVVLTSTDLQEWEFVQLKYFDNLFTSAP